MKKEDALDIENLEQLLERIHGVVGYAVDVDGGGLSEGEFFRSLYVARTPSKEAQLSRFLESSEAGFLAVEGLRGCGKSSFLRAALNRTAAARSLQILYDCDKHKLLLAGAEVLAPSEAYIYYHQQLRKMAIDEMIRRDASSPSKFVVAAKDVRPLQELRLRALLENPRRRLKGAQEVEQALAQLPSACLEQIENLRDDLSLAEIARVQLLLSAKERFLLVVDNLDRIEVSYQPVFLGVLVDTYLGGAGRLGVVVTVRSRNARSVQRSGAGKAGTKAIVLDDQVDDDQGFAEKLFAKRHAYIRETLLAAGHGVAELDQLYAQVELRVSDQFVHEGLTHLANGSYRDVLDLKQQFTEYLLELIQRDVVTWKRESGELELSDFDCRSYLFRWMYALMNDDHEWLLDPVRRYEDYERRRSEDAVGCDLGIVILSWLYSRREQRTRMRDVVRDFETIGVKEPEVRQAVYELYDSSNPRWRHVELGEGEVRVAESELEGNSGLLVEATPLGREYVRSTMLKFEFLVAALQHPAQGAAGSRGLYTQVVDDVAGVLPRLVQYFQMMSKAHTAALIKYKAAYGSTSWESYYRSHFCIGKMLVMERVMRSHLRHIKRRYGTQFEAVHQEYSKLLRSFYKDASIRQDVAKVLNMPLSRSVGSQPADGNAADDAESWEPELQFSE